MQWREGCGRKITFLVTVISYPIYCAVLIVDCLQPQHESLLNTASLSMRQHVHIMLHSHTPLPHKHTVSMYCIADTLIDFPITPCTHQTFVHSDHVLPAGLLAMAVKAINLQTSQQVHVSVRPIVKECARLRVPVCGWVCLCLCAGRLLYLIVGN